MPSSDVGHLYVNNAMIWYHIYHMIHVGHLYVNNILVTLHIYTSTAFSERLVLVTLHIYKWTYFSDVAYLKVNRVLILSQLTLSQVTKKKLSGFVRRGSFPCLFSDWTFPPIFCPNTLLIFSLYAGVVCIYTHIQKHTQMHTQMHTHKYTHTNTHTHTHTWG